MLVPDLEAVLGDGADPGLDLCGQSIQDIDVMRALGVVSLHVLVPEQVEG